MTSPSPLNAAQLDAIKAYTDAAPTDPWTAERGYPQVIHNGGEDILAEFYQDMDAEPTASTFAVRARTDVPALLATVQHLTDAFAAAERREASAVAAHEDAVRITAEQATATAARLDEVTRQRDEFRTAATGREVAFLQTIAAWFQQADEADADGDSPFHRGQSTAIRQCAERLTALLNGGAL